jgi:hypothetical protein
LTIAVVPAPAFISHLVNTGLLLFSRPIPNN